MNKVLLSLLTLLVFTFISCKKDVLTEERTTGNNVKFNLKIANEIDMFKLKSVNTDDFLISVFKVYTEVDSEIVARAYQGDFGPNGVYLETGTYTAYAEYSNAKQAFGWDNPKYFGGTEFTVSAGVTTLVQIPVALTNTKVEVVFSDYLLQIFPEFYAVVCSEESDHCANYFPDSTRIGYFSGTEKLVVQLLSHPSYSGINERHIITGVKPNMHYRLTITASNQAANFGITIEEEDLIEIEYNLFFEPGMMLPDGVGGSSGNDSFSGKTFTVK